MFNTRYIIVIYASISRSFQIFFKWSRPRKHRRAKHDYNILSFVLLSDEIIVSGSKMSLNIKIYK